MNQVDENDQKEVENPGGFVVEELSQTETPEFKVEAISSDSQPEEDLVEEYLSEGNGILDIQNKPIHHKVAHFARWTARLLVPGATLAGPGLGENIRLLFKSPHFKPLRTALSIWLLLLFTFSSLGIYSLINASNSSAATDFSIKTGYYYGDGVAMSITGLGFTPQLVIIKSDTAAGQLVWKSSAMPTSVSSYLGVATADNTESQITLGADGFTVSAALEVNTVRVRYTYIAFAGSDCTSSGTMCIGSYTGNNSSGNQAITTGFQPNLVWVKRTTAIVGNFTTSSMTATHGAYFSATVNNTTGILFQSLGETGFTVGSTNNTNGGLFYYVAFKNIATQMAVGQFLGDNVDGKTISGVGFEPDFVFVKQDSAVVPAFSTTENYGDFSNFTTALAGAVNSIQSLDSDGFQVGNSTSVNAFAINSNWFAFGGAPDPVPAGSFFMQKGSYVGNGTSQTIDTSFQPHLVFIKGNTAQYGVYSSIMDYDQTHYFSTAAAAFASGITSLGATSFAVGSNATVNTNLVTYEWVAFGNSTNPETGAGAADFVIGLYTGNGITGRIIDHLGVAPNMVVLKPPSVTAASNIVVLKTSSMADTTVAYMTATADLTDSTAITTLDTASGGGFTIGSGARANTTAVTYGYFAFKEGSGVFDVGAYTGNSTDDRAITGVGFSPDFLFTKRDAASAPVHKSSSSTIAAGESQHFLNLANDTNDLQTLDADGFTVGNSAEVNTTGEYRYAAWNTTLSGYAPSTPTNSSPASSATGQNLNVTLTGSTYADTDAPPTAHSTTQWQVDDDSDFATPVWTRTSGSAETTKSITSGNGTFANELSGKTELDHATVYYWRVRYSDGIYSSWSTGTSFTSNTITTPTNSSPANLATVTTLTPTLTASAFSDAQTGHTASSSHWQISTNSSFSTTVYDSGTVTYTASKAVPSAELSDNTSYYWRVRYEDSSGMWSEYSTGTKFLTSESKVAVKPLFGSTVVSQADSVKIDAKVELANGTPINDAEVNIDIYNPSGTQIVSDGIMSYVASSSGVYRYAYTIPSTNGSYLYEVTASSSAILGYGASNFEVRGATSVDLTPVTEDLDKLVGAFIVVQASISDATPASNSFNTSLTKSTNNFYKNAVLTFTSGDLNGQSRRISAYDGTTKEVTLSPVLTSTPANGALFTIVGQNVYVQEQVESVQTTLTSIQADITSIISTLDTVDSNLSSIVTKVNNSITYTSVYTVRPEEMFASMNSMAQDIRNIYASLGGVSAPESLLNVNVETLNTLKDIQNKVADLRTASAITRRIVEQSSSEPIVETYMKFNSVEIHFVITNPLDTTQTVKFKSFLPEEAKPEHIIDASGLKVDYDPEAKTYFVSGDISLGGGESATRKVEMKDIWVFEEKDLMALKDQAQKLAESVEKTQFNAQATLLSGDIVTNIETILSRQEQSYTSPQDHIVAYRENKKRFERTEINLEKLRDIVTQSGANQGLAGRIGGIQTFATWGIVLVFVIGIGLLGAVLYSMWKHQMMLASAAISMNRKVLEKLKEE